MTTNASSAQNEATRSGALLDAANGLALVRVTIGAMLVSTFFENLGKGLYTAEEYAKLINSYIEKTHSPDVWKAIMGLVAGHAAIAAPLQGHDRDFSWHPAPHRPAYPSGCIRGFFVSRQPLAFGVGYRVDLGTAGDGARLPWARDRTRRPEMGC